MTIGKHIAVILASVFAGFFLLLLATVMFVIEPSVSDLEIQVARIGIARCEAVLRAEYRRISALTEDWAQWDESFRFLAGENPRFATDYFTDTLFRRHELDFVTYVTPDGTVIWQGTRTPDVTPPFTAGVWSRSDPPFNLAPDQSVEAGLWVVRPDAKPPRLVFVAAARVLPTSAVPPSNGMLLTGRYCDKETIDRKCSVDPAMKRVHGVRLTA
jgi:sensor domain CHASE-containing protein